MKTHLAVHNIKQRDGESTKAFVTQLKTRSLVEFLSTDLPTTYKGLMEKNYTWIDAKEIATNEAPNDYREGFDKFGKGPSWDNNIGRKKDKDRLYSTAIQKIGIVVSIIHAAIKFHTPYRINTVPSSYESNKIKEGEKKIKETIPEAKKDVLICVDAEEKVVVNDKYPEQTVTIGNLLSISLGKKLQDLLRSNVDVFVWNYADMTNEYKHIKPVKQKKRGLGPDYNEAACKEVYELTKNAGATYKILVDKVFNDQIKRNFKAYMDDMLNPKKCSFGVEESSFLGHLITKQGIRDNPSKVKAITDLEPPSTLKDVQSLNGKLAALR
ncbi:hypothetical protein Tco_1041496 [Tanacetum coccineum]|uniref:Uncharacterized protein n=1 Tax=Tanacetum coccineum TaxID=301880 RepID=A0ABQ5GHS2_9ASTR